MATQRQRKRKRIRRLWHARQSKLKNKGLNGIAATEKKKGSSD